MSNPHSAPLGDVDENPAAPPPTKLGFWAVSVSLGVGWWLALLLPEPTSELLMVGNVATSWTGSSGHTLAATAVAWGFARVVGLVVGASAAFRFVARSWPKLRIPCAVACVWLGSGLFAATIDVPKASEVTIMIFVAPLFFFYAAWMVVLPMLLVSVLALSPPR